MQNAFKSYDCQYPECTATDSISLYSQVLATLIFCGVVIDLFRCLTKPLILYPTEDILYAVVCLFIIDNTDNFQGDSQSEVSRNHLDV